MGTEARELIAKLEEVLERTKTKLTEFENGKKVAAPELRKYAQEGKTLFQSFRISIMNELKAMPVKKREKKESGVSGETEKAPE